MTLTVDQLPDSISKALEVRARQEGKSVPDVAIEILASGLGMKNVEGGNAARDLSGVFGTMTAEDAKAIEETVQWMDEGDLKNQA